MTDGRESPPRIRAAPPPEGAVLDRLTLNRALLARQWLLEPVGLPVAAAIEHLVGMQAQVPTDPYLSLRARLGEFAPADLEALILDRSAVRLALFRGTLHLATARDALGIRPLMQDLATRAFRASPFARRLAGAEVEDIVRAGSELLEARPRSLTELGAALRARWPDHDAEAMAYAVRILVPFVQVPPRGLWHRTSAPRIAGLTTWLAGVAAPRIPIATVVRRYLAAFGPSTAADIRAWSGLRSLTGTLAGLRDGLRVYRDEAGRELLDTPDGEFGAEDGPPPIRFLGEYDNVFLAHADRSRITGDVRWGPAWARKRAFFVDGFLAGAWHIRATSRGSLLTIQPAIALSPSGRDEVAAEARAAARFGADAEAGEEVAVRWESMGPPCRASRSG
ncbi:MAG TPA: winged helix DNA-binding domain-containing protein, partial [Candidatus Dormibacteraeota bacterium]|nr:winged helix DNA-binding domain-containing protein [Candidatus Dormibacteraeota bacterium]